MATLKRQQESLGIHQILIEMASSRGFSDFILGAIKYAKNSPKMVIFVHSDFSSFLPITLVQNNKFDSNNDASNKLLNFLEFS